MTISRDLKTRAVEARDNGKAFQLAGFECLNENIIVLENHTPIRVSLGPEYIEMRQETSPSKYLVHIRRFKA